MYGDRGAVERLRHFLDCELCAVVARTGDREHLERVYLDRDAAADCLRCVLDFGRHLRYYFSIPIEFFRDFNLNMLRDVEDYIRTMYSQLVVRERMQRMTMPGMTMPMYMAAADQRRAEWESERMRRAEVEHLQCQLAPNWMPGRAVYVTPECDALAQSRALTLLRGHLNASQRKSFELLGQFEVIGGDTGRRYKVHNYANFNVQCDDGEFYCFMPEGSLALGDQLLAQKIGLECMEKKVMKLANRLGGPGLRLAWWR